MQRTSMSFKSSFGALEDAGGSWLGFGILILISIWSLVFDTLMIWILALFLYFEGAKNIHVLLVLIWGFGGCWRCLTGVWHLDLDWDIVTESWLSVFILKVQRTSMSFKYWFRDLEDAGCSWLEFGIFILVWIWSLVFHAPMFQILALILILKVQRTSMSFKSWCGALEDTGGSWLGFNIMIMTFVVFSTFDIVMIKTSKMQRTSMCLSPEFYFGGWLGFGILIMIHV